MNVISRGVRNAFRNAVRTGSIVIILGLSIGLALTMLVARQAVQAKIASVKSSIGNTITISPAGERGFTGGGNPLTQSQMSEVQSVAHVTGLTEILSDRLDSTQTSLQSSINPGTLGRRFGGGDQGGGGQSGGAAPGGFSGGLGTTTFTLPVTIIGTNAVAGTQVLGGGIGGGGSLKITSGKAFDPTKDADVALVGTALASKNNLKVGSTFTTYGTTVTVAGIYDAGNQFSNSEVVVPLATEQRLSGQSGDITSATVQVDSITNVAAATNAIQKKLGSAADVVSQQDASTQALVPLQNIATISLVSLIGAVVAGGVIILLTMLMIVRERRREIGVLKAIGASNIKVMFQFVTEAITFTLMSAVIGLVIGALGGSPVTKLLVTASSGSGAGAGGMGRPGGLGGGFARAAGFGARGLRDVTTSVGWDILLFGLLAAVVIAVIGSAIPALLIAKVRPAEVMRAE